MSIANCIFSVFSFITLILVLVPLPWHMQAWNIGTCLYILWTALGLFCYFINSIVWRNSAINYAPVWCDISSRIIIGLSVAIPAAVLCINHRLYCILSARVKMTEQENRRAVMVDLSIGLGLPFITMALQYIVQGHRFNIFEEVGCYPFTYNTPPAYVLVFMLPLLIGITSGVYSVLSIIAFRRRHVQLKEVLSTGSSLSSHRFIRLMALAATNVVTCVPLAIAVIILNATRGKVSPWISWSNTHLGFSRVDQFPSLLWRSNPNTNLGVEMSRWLVVLCGLSFFAFFGFTDEALRHYRQAFAMMAKRVGFPNTQTAVGSSEQNHSMLQFRKSSVKASSSFAISSAGDSNHNKPIVTINQQIMEDLDSMSSLPDVTGTDKQGACEIISLPPTSIPFIDFQQITIVG